MSSIIDSIIKWADSYKKAAWKIYDAKSGKTNPIAQSQAENPTPELAMQQLRDALELIQLQGGYINIQLKDALEKSQGIIEMKWQIPPVTSNGVAIAGIQAGMVPQGYISVDEMEKRINDRLDRMLLQQQLEAAQAKLNDLEDELRDKQESAIGSFYKANKNLIDGLAPVAIPALAAKLGINLGTVGVAGINAPPVPAADPVDPDHETNEDDIADALNARLDAVLDGFEMIEGDFENVVVLLEKLLAYAQKNKPTYDILKTQL